MHFKFYVLFLGMSTVCLAAVPPFVLGHSQFRIDSSKWETVHSEKLFGAPVQVFHHKKISALHAMLMTQSVPENQTSKYCSQLAIAPAQTQLIADTSKKPLCEWKVTQKNLTSYQLIFIKHSKNPVTSAMAEVFYLTWSGDSVDFVQDQPELIRLAHELNRSGG